MEGERIDHDLYRGTLDIIVLSLLAEDDDHGYGLIERLRVRSGGRLHISEGAIYPLLHRLQSKKLIRSVWTQTPQNRRAKRYSITEMGRFVLACRSRQWHSLVEVINELLASSKGQGRKGWSRS